ncbi:pyridoxal-dependent decarboxylase [Corynebacterium sp. TAE3-ERU12]|uniref:pyridoxal phosphate-dependent decarboxylase family protein n=1 Tax=Corynebacterium sp. TAE3-ERU12 TaxID=2849491 RepID=UPI001C477FC6|nr:pyridoxal-dependent decarboxylase [Corynebacterium sp. TAE3-ERU12]MBV7294626.1 pyridoxal-dependent decarboxylase [Corynebacterium sp. TAE3-ERU12]
MTNKPNSDGFRNLTGNFLTKNTSPLHSAITEVEAYLDRHFRNADTPCGSTPPGELEKRIAKVNLDQPLGALRTALTELDDLWLNHAVWYHHPQYVSHLNCPITSAAFAGDMVATALNTAIESWDQAGSAASIEQRIMAWLHRLLGWTLSVDTGAAKSETHVRGVFTSGGSQSNLQALLIARNRALNHSDLEGLSKAQKLARLRFFVSPDVHYSVTKGLKTLGVDPEAIITVSAPQDKPGTMDPLRLADHIEETASKNMVPAAVIATAGSTDRGCIDPIDDIGKICAARNIYLHVDAAYGGGLLVSADYRHRLKGIERANSATIDFHKTFFQPVACSALAVQNHDDFELIKEHADYLNPTNAKQRNLADYSLQTTRRFDALKLWLTLRTHGPQAIGEAFDSCIDLAKAIAKKVEAHESLKLLEEPRLTTVLFTPFAHSCATKEEQKELIDKVRDHLFSEGKGVVATTVVDDHPCFKFTVLDPTLSPNSIDDLLHEITRTFSHNLKTQEHTAPLK